MLVRVGVCLAAFAAVTGMSGSAEATSFRPAPVDGRSSVTLAAAPLPRANPARAAPVAPAVEQARVQATAPVAGPFPRRRPGTGPRVVARVENGSAVPVTAFAPADEGPVASLFNAAAAAARGAADTIAPPRASAPLRQSAPQDNAFGARNDKAFARYGSRSGSLKAALDALRADRYDEVFARRNGLSDPLDRMIVDYFVVRAGPAKLSSAMVADVTARAKGWPSARMMRVRFEEALAREAPGADRVIQALAGKAQSSQGARLLAKAYLAKGDRRQAAAIARQAWHNERMGRSLQAAFAKDLSSVLTADDHLTRVDMLVGENRLAEAAALKPRLGTGPRAYVDARVAAAKGEGNANRLLGRVPAQLRRRPGYVLAAAETKRHAKDLSAAARLMTPVSPRHVVSGDGWWNEARIVARLLAEDGKWREAHRLAAKGFAHSAKDRADEAFHAGWFALQGLNDGAKAEKHFAALADIATTPITSARAAYWRGRAAKTRGDGAGARRHFSDAARFGFTYYGQLARAELGRSGTGVARAPSPSSGDKAAISKNPVAQAVERLIRSGHEHRIWPLINHLAETVPTAGQVTLVAQKAERVGKAHFALMAAKDGQRRGLKVGQLAYPTKHIPRRAKMPQGLDRALVYAIARQESQFNTSAKSPAGAAGLMQVMPRTGASVARRLGLKHSTRKLFTDPAHNATLGAAYLAERLGDFNGSYILTFAAYNAGAGRVREWIARFGDPRDPSVDPIVWVEQIPFPETRNYVQRVLENVQVYREALGSGRLAIQSDLSRGRAS
ncbi:MAG: lytic transglycosylase domain-containing protein [Pseudomonadota bacterium]